MNFASFISDKKRVKITELFSVFHFVLVSSVLSVLLASAVET